MYTLTNKNASREALALMEYFSTVAGKKVLSAQHTKTVDPVELRDLKALTGKLPAICGFELLGYSPNINYTDTDEGCIREVMENRNTIDTAIDWALNKKGIVTYTYHWFSPMRGHNKAFYSKYTDYDLQVAMQGDCPEYTALLRDLDLMADTLKRFRDLRIPILWRPLHEAEGGWFWWGKQGPEPCKKLWRLMYDRYVNLHHLDNLIWVWNSTLPQWYPGDDCVDILSRDIYDKENDKPFKAQFDELRPLSPEKPIALAECGLHPSSERMICEKAPWLYSMNWCFGSTLSDPKRPVAFMGPDWENMRAAFIERQKAFYASEYTVTLDDLPWNK